jgi:hypothetical protein
MGKAAIYIYVCWQRHIQFMQRRLAVLSFILPNYDQTITHHVYLRQESIIDGTVLTIISCLHFLIVHQIFINFWIC